MILSYVHTTEGKQHVGIFIFKEKKCEIWNLKKWIQFNKHQITKWKYIYFINTEYTLYYETILPISLGSNVVVIIW